MIVVAIICFEIPLKVCVEAKTVDGTNSIVRRKIRIIITEAALGIELNPVIWLI